MTKDSNPAPTAEQIKRWRRYLAEERMEGATYRELAAKRSGEEAEILNGLAQAEKRHEEYWLELLGEHAYPPPKPSWGSQILALLAKSFGSIFVLALAQRAEQRNEYDEDSDATAEMAADEHIHEEVVRALAARSRENMSGTFRAAVFGANDGLVSNLALILGIAATGTSNLMVIATGIAGLLAGALSMGAGEYISVASQRDLLEASDPAPEVHRALTKLDLHANELELVFRARGDSPEQAAAHAQMLFAAMSRPANDTSTGPLVTRMSMMGAQYQGRNSDEHLSVGTAVSAAVSSFIFFATGALLPLLPFLFGLSGLPGVLASALVVGIALMFIGGVVGILSGKPPFWRGVRQLTIGYGAAAVTYFLGWVFGSVTV
ncbi:membrane protein [Gleimia coleocanis DSM 15436]|uniref:Membrane protein n=1 Tax=Gleimia coleocanis DSM 15436 TaxID=525245 RepID=C0VY47_9ACTO|nr:VIT1/CCC1 family protein [Gleimia coleocanis]EEH64350.1 membrane protein [Gleimia coleocanis DSM 15436]